MQSERDGTTREKYEGKDKSKDEREGGRKDGVRKQAKMD
jgi:hypothetical protein